MTEFSPHVWLPGNSSMSRIGNILDEIHETLPPNVWEHPAAPEPKLRPGLADFIQRTIYGALERNGYHDPHAWLNLVITGSLTTYQYGDTSDCDVSLFANSEYLPEWSRAEMIGIMVGECDGTKLPGTPYPLQCFVVARRIAKGDLYRPGLRSGYDIDQGRWIVPPDSSRSHNVQQEENGFYTYALEAADKMDRLLQFEPDKARQYFEAIRRRRREDQTMGRGDFSESNIVYKFLEKRGLTPTLEQLSPSWVPHAQFRSQALRRSSARTAGSHPIIDHTEARGNSRPVSLAEFQHLAEEGRQRYQDMLSNVRGTTGLDANWPGIKASTYDEILKPWGGATIDPHTGQALPQGADLYALTARPPGMQPISLPENPSPEEWHAGMDAARQAYGGILDREGHHLGVFHDDDLHRVDIDPTIIVNNPHDVETIGAYTRNVGGAYHFATGNGYWPPHVAPGQEAPVQQPDPGTVQPPAA